MITFKKKKISEPDARSLLESDVKSLIEANKILRNHLNYLRIKLKKTESILELCITLLNDNDNLTHSLN